MNETRPTFQGLARRTYIDTRIEADGIPETTFHI
jgi:hypothetical protein